MSPAPALPVWLSLHKDGVTVAVHAQPNAKTSAVVGIHGDALKIKVAARPEDGAANAALLAFVDTLLAAGRGRTSLVSGPTNRRKVLLIKGVDPATVARMLSPG